jgi:outer membrane protein assembly factor BamB
LTIGPTGGEFAAPLRLVELHPETGDVLARQLILDTTPRENSALECQAVFADHRLIVMLAGNIIAVDLQGRIAWLRAENCLPDAVDPVFAQQHCQPAIVSEGRLFIQQPGNCAIDCLDVDTGERRWRRAIVGLQQIFNLSEDRLLARTARGMVAVKKSTGEVLWQREFPGLLAALARTSSGMILGARQASIANKPQLQFLWIESTTGRTRAYSLTPLEQNQSVFFGPIAAAGNRTWCCFGHGVRGDSPTAENFKRIIELRPDKPASTDEEP